MAGQTLLMALDGSLQQRPPNTSPDMKSPARCCTSLLQVIQRAILPDHQAQPRGQ